MPKPYTPNDKWSQRAAKEGYRARSVYKLMELDEKFGLLKPGMTVVDLGAAPGSWLQYVSKKIGPKGWVFGFDLQKIKPVASNVKTFVADVTDTESLKTILNESGAGLMVSPSASLRTGSVEPRPADILLSDMAPHTTGIKNMDHWKSVELAQVAFALAEDFLKPGGYCVVKIFRGAEFETFIKELRTHWQDIRMMTVAASRDRSREIYLVARKAN